MDRRFVIGLLVLCALLAGCSSSELPGIGGPVRAPEGTASPVATVEADVQVAFLGLAYWADVPRDAVATRLADGFQAVACFGGPGIDVILVVTREQYLGEHAPPAVALVALLTCAQSEHERDDANEPPWYVLAGWATPEHAEFLTARGQLPGTAEVRVEGDSRAFRFEARAAEGLLVRGEFQTPRVPTPNPFLPDCSSREMIGRAITATEDIVAALDWTKLETTCSAAATIEWPEGGALEEILGRSRPPAGAWDVEVHEAAYAWRRLA